MPLLFKVFLLNALASTSSAHRYAKNVTSKNAIVKEKSCDAQIEVVNSQIILYEIENGKLPTKMSQLTSGGSPYLTEKQAVCPNGKKIQIKNGQAYVK